MRRAPFRQPFRSLAWHLLLAVILFTAGCGGDPFRYVKVSGKVSYENGTVIPAERITVTFVPLSGSPDQKVNPRAGQAEVNVKDGTFGFASTQKLGDGIVAGRHRVLVTAYDQENLPSNAIPEKYHDHDASPFIVEASDTPFHFKIALPAH